jgi:UDPglucose--hexose-1-phosphate uridylyltransferase
MAVRRHPISGEPILFAPGRAGRPNAFGRSQNAGTCPFCPGNESETPPEIARHGDPWRVRVFPNKYPAVEGHEVIVDSNRHDASFDKLHNAPEVTAVLIERYRAHADAAYVSVFKNEGERAGASIEHIHSQVMPLEFVPPRVERELAAFEKDCPLCARFGTVIEENESFVRVAPDAAQYAYEQWIVPRRHQADFTTLSTDEVAAMAATLQSSVRAARAIAAAHNVLFMNFPAHSPAHFYIDVFPRLTAIAGFELATGMFIDIIDPAATARRLR